LISGVISIFFVYFNLAFYCQYTDANEGFSGSLGGFSRVRNLKLINSKENL